MGACLSVHPSIPLLNPRAGRQLHPTPLLLLLTAALPGGERHLLYQLQHPSVQVKTQQLGSLVRAGTGSEGGERCRMEPSSLEAGKKVVVAGGRCVPRAVSAAQGQNAVAACSHSPWGPRAALPSEAAQGHNPLPHSPGPPSVPRFQSHGLIPTCRRECPTVTFSCSQSAQICPQSAHSTLPKYDNKSVNDAC